MSPVEIAGVGAGYWGKNLVRVFRDLPDVRLRQVCDADPAIRSAIQRQFPEVATGSDYDLLLQDEALDAVVLAVPAALHYALACQALERGKHVYVEKPMTLNAADAQRLVELAAARDRVLMVGHLLEYHPAVQMLRRLVQSGELGDIYYVYSQRVNLGIVRSDENALWSLAPHDISVILHLLGQEPDAVSARGECYLQPDIEDVVFANLHFADGKMAQLQLSWLDPHRIRRLTVVGSRKMAVFDDVESAEKVRIYDKSAERPEYDSYGESITLRFGDVVIPRLEMAEPLKLECQHFADCVRSGQTPLSDGHDGLRVVRVLEAAQESLRQNGVPVEIG
ncbi:MAG: Gfo/Idh/MocA family oxidoreductase [Candidatus Latescibacterota bacterium]|nr:Gfo/Idh/MocA family oxidoreductase [Candidatus Latescibacterota bacterium]